MSDLCFLDAVELTRLIRSREVSAVDVMRASLAQIDRVNARVNAICTLVDRDRLLAAARAADARLAAGDAVARHV